MRDFNTCRNLFVERFKELLNNKSIVTFSKQVNIPERTIFGWLMKETTPSMEYITMLVQHLNCTADYLLGLRDE